MGSRSIAVGNGSWRGCIVRLRIRGGRVLLDGLGDVDIMTLIVKVGLGNVIGTG